MSEVLPRAGKRCAFLAAGGSIGRLSSPVWVDFMVLWLEVFTVMGFWVGCLFWRGVVIAK